MSAPSLLRNGATSDERGSETTPLVGTIVDFGSASIVAVGPWLMSVLALSVISLTLTPALGRAAIEDLRLSVIYAFALALAAAAPTATLAARRARRAVDEDGGRLAPEIYAVALIVGGVAALALAIAAAVGFGVARIGYAVAFVALTTSASMLWTSFAMLSALRQFWRVVGCFAIGVVVGVGFGLGAMRWTSGVEALMWSFALGLSLAHALMFAAATGQAAFEATNLREAARAVAAEIEHNRPLFAGILFAVIAIWADKLVFWFGPHGVTARSGFAHFPTYDSAMFIAHLSMIPTLASWLQFQRGALEPALQALWRQIASQPTYGELSASADALRALVWSAAVRILFVQATCAGMLVMLTPAIVGGVGIQIDQIELIRVGAVAVLMQAVFFVACSVLMICDQTAIFRNLNLGFLVMNFMFGLIFQFLFGVSTYGVFAASLICGGAGILLARRALADFLFSIFVGENAGLYAEPKRRFFPALSAEFGRATRELRAAVQRVSREQSVFSRVRKTKLRAGCLKE